MATLVASAALIGTATLGGATGASADIPGDGNPAIDCPGGSTVAQATIRNSSGTAVGLVEMRWSWACSGNWTRVTSWAGAQNLTAVISYDVLEGVPVAEGDDYASQNFSPYLRVAPSQHMCSYGAISISGTTYDARVCSG